MTVRSLLLPALLVAAAAALIREAVARDGVSPFEYAVVALLAAALLWFAFSLVRSSWLRRSGARVS
jgi:predicted permease